MTIDQQRLDEFLAGFAADQAAAMHLSTVVLGEQLGLYRALAEGGRQTAQQLARRTGYEPRLVTEWLRAQAVSGYCAHDADAGTYWPAYLTHLVSSWVPALDGVEERLRDGGRIADVACGFGVTTMLLAEAFPAASVAGLDSHGPSIEAARRAAADAGVAARVTFTVADASELPGEGYDLVCFFNALHEMGDPVRVCRRIRDALADGGVLMLVEPNAGDTDEDNRTPVGRNFTSASTMVCLPSALSQGGSWHLGAQAPDREFAAVATEAGFSRCRRVAQTPLHRVLEITG